jgi:hypothetical protein
VSPKGAPNILLTMTDDAGYGVSSTFGGVVPTPALGRVARGGLRYTNFNSTALCPPTRAALTAGRNHHPAGFGVISEIAKGFPGYNGIITRDKATVGRALKDNGYRTSWFGKDHNTPAFQAGQDGPFDQWPIGVGFEYTAATPVFPDRSLSSFCFVAVGDDELAIRTDVAHLLPPVAGERLRTIRATRSPAAPLTPAPPSAPAQRPPSPLAPLAPTPSAGLRSGLRGRSLLPA